MELTLSEAAEQAHVNLNTLRDKVQMGVIPSRLAQVGKISVRMVWLSDVQRAVADGTFRATPGRPPKKPPSQ